MNYIYTLLIIFISYSGFTQDSTDYKSDYKLAKKEYKAFENNHGNYFQTSNVNMHYSTWGKKNRRAIFMGSWN